MMLHLKKKTSTVLTTYTLVLMLFSPKTFVILLGTGFSNFDAYSVNL